MGLFKDINWRYGLTILIISCGSIPKGYDEGGFSASITLPSYEKDFHTLKSEWKHNASGLANRTGNITSFGVLGAAVGALACLLISDRLGRLRTWQLSAVWWASGLLMQIFSSGIYGFELFARFWGGLGAGSLTVVVPIYLGECAPTRSRGKVTTWYMVSLLSFLMLGFWINYGASKDMAATRTQYRLVQSIPLIPVGLAFIGSFFITDTPRWLASQDRTEEALEVLTLLRKADKDTDAVAIELEYIREQVRFRAEALQSTSSWTIAKEVVTIRKYRERFLLGFAFQVIGQWTGGNGITFYIPEIFTFAGVTGANQSLITSGAYGFVKLVFTIVFAVALVDYFGRRKTTLTGLFLQLISHIWMAIYMSLYRDGSNKSASDAAIAAVFIYAVGWSIGLCNTMALYATETQPTRTRSFSYAVNMGVHWFCQFAVVKATPSMFVGLGVAGAYIFWACICAFGLVLFGVWAPETKGVPMERMDELFAGPWYMGWKAKIDLSVDPSQLLERRSSLEKQAEAREFESNV